MGLMAAIIGWLQYHLGLRTDAASSTGSLHAKMGNLNSQLASAQNTVVSKFDLLRNTKPYAAAKYSGIPSWGTPATVLSISGSGYLTGINAYAMGFVPHDDYNDEYRLTIRIDGRNIPYYGSSVTAERDKVYSFFARFNSSLEITVLNARDIEVAYILD